MQAIDFRRDILPLKDKLFRIALRIVADRAEAEDIVQEAMIRVWNRREEWPQLDSVEAFCYTIVRNLAIDRSERADRHLEQIPADYDCASSAAGPLDHLVQKERLRLVHTLISQLPEQQRSIMQLRDVEGKSYRDIANIMGLSEEQVKVYLHRARQKVKQQFLDIDQYGLQRD